MTTFSKPFKPAAVAVSIDQVLRRKKLEDELENYRLHLEEMVKDRTFQLQGAMWRRSSRILYDETLQALAAALDLRDNETMSTVLGKEKADAFWDEYMTAYYTDKDAEFLEKEGFNVLRVPIDENRIEDPNQPGHYDEGALRHLDTMIRISKAHGIYVILDLHAVMGGQSREIYADSLSATPDFWRYADFRMRATAFWVALAKRYRNETAVAGYDLVNEPNTEGHTELLTAWLRETHRQIRQVDPVHLIWLSGDDYGKNFQGLPDEFWNDKQTVFQFHIYPFFAFPLSKMTDYPQTIDGVRYDKAYLRNLMHEQIAFGRRRPVYMGEFGAENGAREFVYAMVRDMISIADEEGWSWTEWTYKDVGGQGLVTVRADTPWRIFLASPEVKAEREKARVLLGSDDGPRSEDSVAKMTAQILSNFNFEWWPRQYEFVAPIERAFDDELTYAIVFHLKDKSETEMRQLADSFAFDSCSPSAELVELYLIRKGQTPVPPGKVSR